MIPVRRVAAVAVAASDQCWCQLPGNGSSVAALVEHTVSNVEEWVRQAKAVSRQQADG